jgi:dihydrofolate reductase
MKNIVFIASSLDGFIAREDGDINWLNRYESNTGDDYGFKKFMDSIDAIVMGRVTYEKALSFPRWLYTRKVYVLSTTLKEIPAGLKDKAALLSMNPVEVVKHLSEKGLFHLYIDGGKTIQSFLRYDLIDEMIITWVPVLLGSGIPLFGSLNGDIHFSHVKTTPYPNGLVMSHYIRARE